MGTRRPWKAFVHSIGPCFSFATEERAMTRARELTAAEYATVSVYNVGMLRRTLVHHDGREVRQTLVGGFWTDD